MLRAARIAFLLLVTAALPAAAAPLFSEAEPFGTQGTTSALALGDLDTDGDLDLVCGILNGPGTLYRNASPDRPLYDNPDLLNRHHPVTFSVAVGEVDGDGRLDLAMGTLNGVTLYPAAGDPLPLGPGTTVFSLALGDLDGDGDLDLVTGGFDVDAIHWNGGGGTWSLPDTFALGSRTRAIALGDLDQDGDLDIVAGNDGVPGTIFRNDGGAFSAQSFGAAMPTWSVALGDLDGDGDLDLVTGAESQDTGTPGAQWYRNDAGAFTVAGAIGRVFLRVRRVTLGDVDQDGDLDVALGIEDAPNEAHVNRGGSFQTTADWSGGASEGTRDLALADIDGDGDLDLVCGNDGVNSIHWNLRPPFAGRPGATFGPADTRSLAVGDVDQDGDLDIVAGNHGATTLHRNDGGVFPAVWSGPADSTNAVSLGDVNGDARLDLVCGNGAESMDRASALFLGASGAFQNTASWTSLPRVTNGIALADWNGDGRPDLASANGNGLFGQKNTLYRNTGSTLSPDADSLLYADVSLSVAVGDVDGDGRVDLVFGNDGYVGVERGTGSGFTPGWSSSGILPDPHAGVALGDLDADGDLDLVSANPENGNAWWVNAGGDFGLTSRPIQADSVSTSLALGDVDGDGDLDACFGNYGHASTLFRNDGGTFQLAWSSAERRPTRAVALADLDRDGDLDLVLGNGSGGADSSVVFPGLANPPLGGDLSAPRNHLPENPPFFRDVTILPEGANERRVRFRLLDAESDPTHVLLDYQFEGASAWQGIGILPLLAASPEGVEHEFLWDLSLFPDDRRNVAVRLRAISVPRRVSTIQNASAYLVAAGSIAPVRPHAAVTPLTIDVPGTLTLGDTAAAVIGIANLGNEDLVVSAASLPAGAWVLEPFPRTVLPGGADSLHVGFAPGTTDAPGAVLLHTNDPFRTLISLPIVADVRAPAIAGTRLVFPQPVVPLGEAVYVLVTPAPGVRVERGFLHLRAGPGPGAFPDSIPLAPLESSWLAVVPGAMVTETGFAYYARVENSGFAGVDPPGAPDAEYFQAVEAPASVLALPQPNAEGSVVLEGRDVQVQVELPAGALFAGGALHYRPAGTSAYASAAIQAGVPFPSGILPGSVVGYRGVDYWIEVTTATSHLTDPPESPAAAPRSLRVTTENIAETEEHPGGVYRLVSLPLEPSGTFLESLTDDLGNLDPAHWRLFAYEPASTTYVEVPGTGPCCFEAGRSYWLITRDTHRIDSGPLRALSTPAGGPFSLPLRPGQNLVADPFGFSVPWASMQVVSAGETTSVVGTGVLQPPAAWTGKQPYQFDVPVLDPFSGYWIKNLTGEEVVLLVPPVEADSTDAALAPAAASGGWMLRIGAESGSLRGEVALGVRDDALSAHDRFDRAVPPLPPGRMLSLDVADFAWSEQAGRYAVDVRPAGDSGRAWLLDVAKNYAEDPAGDLVTLTVQGVESVPSEVALVLIDRRLDRRVDLRTEPSARFFLGERALVRRDEDARFVLLAGDPAFVREWDGGTPGLPTRAFLYAAAPNPFSDATTVRFDVALLGRASLRIFDARGGLVTVLADREFPPGRYELLWNGTDARGERAAGGIYFVQLREAGSVQSGKLLLVR